MIKWLIYAMLFLTKNTISEECIVIRLDIGSDKNFNQKLVISKQPQKEFGDSYNVITDETTYNVIKDYVKSRKEEIDYDQSKSEGLFVVEFINDHKVNPAYVIKKESTKKYFLKIIELLPKKEFFELKAELRKRAFKKLN